MGMGGQARLLTETIGKRIGWGFWSGKNCFLDGMMFWHMCHRDPDRYRFHSRVSVTLAPFEGSLILKLGTGAGGVGSGNIKYT